MDRCQQAMQICVPLSRTMLCPSARKLQNGCLQQAACRAPMPYGRVKQSRMRLSSLVGNLFQLLVQSPVHQRFTANLASDRGAPPSQHSSVPGA